MKRSDIRQEIGRADVPVRIARTIVQVQVIRPHMRTVVTVAAHKGRESRNPRHRILYPIYKFKKVTRLSAENGGGVPPPLLPLLLRSYRLF